MRVAREFSNPDVVRQLETVDEEQLAAILDELDDNTEIAAAIRYSEQQDAQHPPISAHDFLKSIRR